MEVPSQISEDGFSSLNRPDLSEPENPKKTDDDVYGTPNVGECTTGSNDNNAPSGVTNGDKFSQDGTATVVGSNPTRAQIENVNQNDKCFSDQQVELPMQTTQNTQVQALNESNDQAMTPSLPPPPESAATKLQAEKVSGDIAQSPETSKQDEGNNTAQPLKPPPLLPPNEIPALNENNHTNIQVSSIDSTLKAVESIYKSQPTVQNPNADNEVIELSDDDGEEGTPSEEPSNKRQCLEPNPITEQPQTTPASASNAARNHHMPQWMKEKQSNGTTNQNSHSVPHASQRPLLAERPTIPAETQDPRPRQREPYYVTLPATFVPSWQFLLPLPQRAKRQEAKSFELSLLNVREFTITGVPVRYDGPPSSVSGLRKKIKEISKGHGKAIFDRDKEGTGGKWRIPLGAYRSFFSYLNSDPMVSVVGIPENQLKIASLGKARLERGFPSARKLVSKGVPMGLAKALAPFQRGGVDFIHEKDGRALIADDMGLGKTIQAIAGMTLFHEEWPILVLTPSSARYHWENEFQNWLGVDSPVNKGQEDELDLGDDDDNEKEEETNNAPDDAPVTKNRPPMTLLKDSQIHVLTASKDDVLPNESTRVVICSYGLAPALVETGKIRPGQFRCAIVDESHMLKNMATKRTSTLVPILHATSRCVLLSGTPALARPSELFPQLKILSTERDTWWKNEDEFVDKYVKRSTPARRAELYAMLTGTVMIRRLKADILKSLPSKVREKSICGVSTPDQRREFQECMTLLREGKGVMGKLARQHSALDNAGGEQKDPSEVTFDPIGENTNKNEQARASLAEEYKQRYNERMMALHYTLSTTAHQLDPVEKENFVRQQEAEYRRELDVWYRERIHEIESDQIQLQNPELTRKSALNHMYTLTAKAKVPLIADMIIRWLKDPTKGKLCVFAHHIFVLDELVKLVGLSNKEGSDKKYIRIDGSTSPKHRQAQIKSFQTDPDVRIAILGITAAGVAVTLTASSTVWFAELFWTPALMVQAEDRCHRIGQNSQVKCLYFVAVGTLDELLWKLLEKKFRDLGEFVEGKEKMKIVVHKIFRGEKDLHSMFKTDEAEKVSETLDLEKNEEGSECGSFLDLEKDLEQDIAMLGKEELTMILPEGEEDEIGVDGKPFANGQKDNVPGITDRGRSEDEAIVLLSDDEDEKVPAVPNQKVSPPGPEADSPNVSSSDQQATEAAKQPAPRTFESCFAGSLPRCRFYNLLFVGPSYGIQLVIYNGRAVVGKKIDPTYTKPAVGDILVAMNGSTIPLLREITALSAYLKAEKMKAPVELTFAEDEGFADFFNTNLLLAQKSFQEARKRSAQQASQGAGEVIELLDDD